MYMLKIAGYGSFVVGLLLLALAFAIPESRVGLLIGAAALVLAGIVDLWFYYYFTPAMRKLPKPAGMENEDITTLRGSMRVGRATREQGIAKMESATAMMKELNRANRLREHGTKARAEVLAIRDTGQLINFDPVLEFDLAIMPAEGDAYQVSGYQQVVSKVIYPQIQVGLSYSAFIDPADPNSVLVSWL